MCIRDSGSSELLSNISASVVSILYNLQLMRLIGEMGVAAYSVMMYVDFVFVAAFLGFSMGSAPVVSYHYGAKNHAELKSVFRKSMRVILVTSVLMVLISELLSRPLSSAFVGFNPELLEMTVHGFRLFALCYFFCGLNIYASAFFTALCNGALSALLSFLRTLLLRGGCVLLLAGLFGLNGIWGAVDVYKRQENKRCSVHRHKARHYPAQYNCRRHNYSRSFESAHWLFSVSYTHLDVYKRQDNNSVYYYGVLRNE